VAAAVEQTESELGPIERVLKAAAIMPTAHLMEQDPSVIHRIWDINYGGVVCFPSAEVGRFCRREGIAVDCPEGVVPRRDAASAPGSP
jgi:NAD(P)-dependent dehydrogenase (short-subunit alcohol dehydrogenase family)